MLNSYEAVEHILASVVRQDGSLVLCCMFVTDMEEGYLQLKNEDVTESDFFGVKTNHSSVVAQKILHFFFLVWYCNNLGTSIHVKWFIPALKYI